MGGGRAVAAGHWTGNMEYKYPEHQVCWPGSQGVLALFGGFLITFHPSRSSSLYTIIEIGIIFH